MNKFNITFAAFIVLLASIGNAKDEFRLSALSLVTRNQDANMRVIYDIWSTEYPSPVVDVNSKNKRSKTKVQAYKSIKTLNEKVSCTIKNGLYHPWSSNGTSAKGYFTIAENLIYSVEQTNAALDSNIKLPTGSIISEVIYLSEGFCAGVLMSNEGTKNKTTVKVLNDFDCSALEDKSKFRKKSDDSVAQAAEQWIKLSCDEGYIAYVQDSALLAAPGIKEGVITGFGSVGPATGN